MGCSASKAISSGEEAPSGLRPIRRKIEQIRRQRRGRKDSIVSTTELLGGAPEEILVEVTDDEELQVDASPDAAITKEEINVADDQVSPDIFALPPPPPPPEAEMRRDVDGTDGEVDEKDGQEKGEKEKEIGGEEKSLKEEEKGEEKSLKEEEKGDEKREKEEEKCEEEKGGGWKGGELLRPRGEEEEFPGSPSFRVYSPYYRGSGRCSSDEDSEKTGSSVIEDDGSAGNKGDDHERKDSLGSSKSEGSESGKLTKKNRGRRFKALAVCSLLSVKSCYHTNAIQNDKPHLLSQKAA